MLLFRSEEHVERWAQENGVPKRPLVSLEQLWMLAWTWYANRLSVDSRRPAAGEMKEIFDSLGLTGDFWEVPVGGVAPPATGT